MSHTAFFDGTAVRVDLTTDRTAVATAVRNIRGQEGDYATESLIPSLFLSFLTK